MNQEIKDLIEISLKAQKKYLVSKLVDRQAVEFNQIFNAYINDNKISYLELMKFTSNDKMINQIDEIINETINNLNQRFNEGWSKSEVIEKL